MCKSNLEFDEDITPGNEREESFVFDRRKRRVKLASLSYSMVGLLHVDPTHEPGAYSSS